MAWLIAAAALAAFVIWALGAFWTCTERVEKGNRVIRRWRNHVSLEDLARAEGLSKAIGGWVRYDFGPQFVPAGEWAQRHSAWLVKVTPRCDAVQFPWARRIVDGPA